MQLLLLTLLAAVQAELHADQLGPSFQELRRNVHSEAEAHVQKKSSHLLFHKSVGEAADQAVENAGQSEAADEASKEVSKEVSKDASKEVSEEVSKEVAEEVAEEASEEVSEADSEEAAAEATEETAKELSKETAREAAQERAASREEMRMRRERLKHRQHRLHREMHEERNAMRARRMAEREQRRQIPINVYAQQKTAGMKINRLIEGFLSAPPVRVNNHILPRRPLVFMHQAKSGGTSLRQSLHDGAKHLGLATYIPCHDVDCQEYNTVGHTAAIYGGHFCWTSMAKDFAKRGVNDFSCVTIFRDPVPRVLSCYSYRMVGVQGSAPTCVADIAPERLKNELVGHACVDEPFRRIGDCNAAGEIEHFQTDQEHVAGWALTLNHLSKCVPLIIEEPESYKVAAAAFPQLADAFLDLGKVKLNKNKEYDSRCHPSPAHLRAVRTVTSQESRIYRAARKRMWQLHRLLVK